MTTNKERKIVGRRATNTIVHRRVKGWTKKYSGRVNGRAHADANPTEAAGGLDREPEKRPSRTYGRNK